METQNTGQTSGLEENMVDLGWKQIELFLLKFLMSLPAT